MAMGTVPLLISVVKSNKYALLGVLGFDAKGGHITYENTYHSGTRAMQLWPRPQAPTGAGGCDRRVSRRAFQPCMGRGCAAFSVPLLFAGECRWYGFRARKSAVRI